MAATDVQTNNREIVWTNQIIREFNRENLFSPYYGNSTRAIIRNITDLERKPGEEINVPLMAKIDSKTGVGIGPLVNNETRLDLYGMRIRTDWARNGVLIPEYEEKVTFMDLADLARDELSDWGNNKQRDDLIRAFHSIPSEAPSPDWKSEGGQTVNGIQYAQATTAQKNAWHNANQDRLQYGSAVSNFVTSNHAASLANIDSTNDKFTKESLELMKRRARNAKPKITPYKTEDGKEWFVAFVGSRLFRDLGNSLASVDQAARAREGDGMMKNPLYVDGDLLWRGIIIREIPEMDDLTVIAGAGASGIDVAPVFLCGQSAAAIAWSKMPTPRRRKEDDYEMWKGVGLVMSYGVAKLAKIPAGQTTLKDWGVFTGYFSAVADV